MKSIRPHDMLSTELYRLLSIARAAAPSDSEGTWFRYVIVQGTNEIAGLRAGSAEEVEVAVREMVDRLNERSKGHNAKKIKAAYVPPAQAASSPVQDQS